MIFDLFHIASYMLDNLLLKQNAVLPTRKISHTMKEDI